MTDITTHKASRRRLLIALAITSSFMVIQFFAAGLSNSMSVLADAGHLFIHNSSLIVALIASSIAIKLASNFNAGYHKAEYAGGLINGILYLVIAGVILFTGGNKLFEHHSGETIHQVDSYVMTAVSGVGFLFHTASAYILYQGRKDSVNVYAVFLHSFLDLLSTIMTFVVGIVIYFTGWVHVDLLSSLLIAAFVLVTGIRVIFKCVKGILADSEVILPTIEQLETRLASLAHVSSVHNLTLTQEGKELLCGAHIVLKASCTKELHHELCQREIERCLKLEFSINKSVLQIEAHSCDHCTA